MPLQPHATLFYHKFTDEKNTNLEAESEGKMALNIMFL